jgi:hypothetical protein
MLRFDALVLGVLATGASFWVNRGLTGLHPSLVVGPLAVGFGALVASTLFAIRAYRYTGSEVGPRAEDLQRARREGAGLEEIPDASFRVYARGIQENRRSLTVSSRRLRGSLRSLGWGLAFIAGSTAILMVLQVAW